MRNLYFLALFALLGWSCQKDQEALTPTAILQSNHAISLDEAKSVVYEQMYLSTRTTTLQLPFVLGDALLDWTRAERSQDEHISTIDIPVMGDICYTVIRKNEEGVCYNVEASSKLVAVQSFETGELQAYIRTSIPDENYFDFNGDSGKLCDLSLNCGDRGNFSGIELYSTLDGHLVALSKYLSGEVAKQLFLCDESLSVEEKREIVVSILDEMMIIPGWVQTRNSGIDSDEWPYGRPNSFFWGNDGELYIYLDNDGDGISDSIIDYRSWMVMIGIGGSGGGGSSGSGSGGSTGGGSTGGGSTPGGGAVGGGSSGGGGNGSGTTPSDGDNDSGEDDEDDSEGDDNSGFDNGGYLPGVVYPGGGFINPLPRYGHFLPIVPPDEDEESEEEYYQRLGEEAFAKIREDIESGNYLFYDCTVDNSGNVGEALLNAAGVGLNTNDFILLFMKFFDDIPKDAIAFGKIISGANFVVGAAQTVIGCSDGDITTADALNALSTILSGLGYAVAFTPLAPVAPYLGIASCVVGLASNCFTYYGIPTIIRVKMDSGEELNILIC